MTFVDRLQAIMDERNITDNTFVTEGIVSNGTIGKWRSGKNKPSIDAVRDIASYLNVSADYLLGLTDRVLPIKDYTQNEIPDSLQRAIDGHSRRFRSRHFRSYPKMPKETDKPELSEEEKLLLTSFRAVDMEGKFRIIQVCMNERDEERKREMAMVSAE